MSSDATTDIAPRRIGPDRALVAVFAIALGWSYWPTLAAMWGRWMVDPRYSHGFLVPAFSLFLLWHRREGRGPATPRWWGLGLIAVSIGMRVLGTLYYLTWIDAVSLLPALAGLAVLVGGKNYLAWSWPAIAFLFFMIPLPYSAEMMLGHPPQRLATLVSTYALQTFGLPAIAEGNVIQVNEARLGVVEACNGLGMLFMFSAFAVGAAFVIRRPLADRIAIVLSAIPTALLANILRITITGLLQVTVGGPWAEHVYHDLAGWFMMPMALGFLWAELWIMSRLLVEHAPRDPMSFVLRPGR